MKNWIFILLVGCQSYAQAPEPRNLAVSDTSFVRLSDYSSDFVYDMKYASTDNFLHANVYGCAECYMRQATAMALAAANEKFKKKGYRIKLFDCYRPLDIQKKMWAIVSNPKYVADPKNGSIHNKGGAVDLTIIDSAGKEIDMGTKFDYFGPESAHGYRNLSKQIRSNRKLLRKVMTSAGFKTFASEWWHYNIRDAKKLPVSNFKWKCK